MAVICLGFQRSPIDLNWKSQALWVSGRLGRSGRRRRVSKDDVTLAPRLRRPVLRSHIGYLVGSRCSLSLHHLRLCLDTAPDSHFGTHSLPAVLTPKARVVGVTTNRSYRFSTNLQKAPSGPRDPDVRKAGLQHTPESFSPLQSVFSRPKPSKSEVTTIHFSKTRYADQKT